MHETAEFDRSKTSPDRTPGMPVGKVFTDYNKAGKADVKNRLANPRYGDNALDDPTDDEEGEGAALLNEFSPTGDVLDRLHAILTDEAGVSDDEIIAGIDLSDRGRQIVAARLGVSPEEVVTLINSLCSRLRKQENDPLAETYRRILEQDRFAFEKDRLGNLTVRDTVSGNERFVAGSVASGALRLLSRPGIDQQQVLARLMAGDLHEAAEAAQGEGFDREINADGGTFNFLWRHKGQQGFATASYGSRNGRPALALEDVRGPDGTELHPDHAMHADLLRQARNAIPEV